MVVATKKLHDAPCNCTISPFRSEIDCHHDAVSQGIPRSRGPPRAMVLARMQHKTGSVMKFRPQIRVDVSTSQDLQQNSSSQKVLGF
jgi:hypothetical protein